MPRTFRFVIVLICLSLLALSHPWDAAAYTVQAGDTPLGIAKKHGISVDELMKANKGLKPSKMHVGDDLVIPGSSSGKTDGKHAKKPDQTEKSEKSAKSTATSAKDRAAEAKDREAERKAAASKSGGSYTVKKGDTLGSIAAKHGITTEELIKANKALKSHHALKVGEHLTLPGGAPAAAEKPEKEKPSRKAEKEKAAAPEHATYTAGKHDTPHSVARKFHISPSELARLNPDMGKKLHKGQKLVVPARSKGTAAPEEEPEAAPTRTAEPEVTPTPPAKAPVAETPAEAPAKPTKAPETAAPTPPVPATKETAEAEAAFEKGIDFGKQNNFAKAVDSFNRAIKLNPNRADFYASRGHAHYYMKQYPKAIDDYTKAIEKNPNFALAYSMRGLSRTRSGQYPKAVEDFNKAITFGPNEADYYKGRGFTYLLMEQYGPMCQDYQKACSLGDCELLDSAKKEKKCQ